MHAVPNSNYRIGIVCALPKEMAAIAAVLDEEHAPEGITISGNDTNTYMLGRIHQHNVVIACLPAGVYGTNAAAVVASNMVGTFANVRLGLMVEIGGGVPSLPEQDIRLGDVVVSQPDGAWPGVVQYDMGKNLGANRFERTGSLDKPPTSLLTAMSSLQAHHYRIPSLVSVYMKEAVQRSSELARNGYIFPSTNRDFLHCAYCNSSRWWWRWWLLFWWLCTLWRCKVCVNGRVLREKRQNENPVLHYGTIASSNSLIRDATLRDRLRKRFKAKCLEMEAAGLMDDFRCVVIRGICDYADAYKNDDWQEYAALAAAAFAKELLLYVVSTRVDEEKPLGEVLCILEKQTNVTQDLLEEAKQHNKKAVARYDSERHRECHRVFKTSTYEEFKNYNPERAPGTCKWALGNPTFGRWSESTENDLLWISADPGCGKSVLARSLIDNELQRNNEIVCYFFFKDNTIQDKLSTALCAVIHQLFNLDSGLIQHALSAWENSRDCLVLDVEELWRIFLAASTSPELNVTCVFDALDECRDTDRLRLIRFLAEFYQNPLEHRSIFTPSANVRRGRLKFLVTSRPYSDIQEAFHLPRHLPSIRIRGEDESEQIRQEIDTVVKLRVHDLAIRLDLDNQVTSQLETRLLNMEHRTYLWLHLAFKNITETLRDSLRPAKEAIEYLPSSVDDAYEKILNKVSKQEKKRKYVIRILQIIVGARRPLTLSEMAIALGIATSQPITTLNDMKINERGLKERIRQLCGLFVCFSHSRIFLIHQTAKEFLIREPGQIAARGTWKHCLDLVEVETEMARICVELLSLLDPEEVSSRGGFPYRLIEIDDMTSHTLFVIYSLLYWATHFRNGSSFTEEWISTKVFKVYGIYSQTSQSSASGPVANALRRAAFYGHEAVIKLLLRDKKWIIDYSHDDLNLAARLAFHSGLTTAMPLFLSRGADVDALNEFGQSLLCVASESGDFETVRLFIEEGAGIDIPDDFGKTALDRASGQGHYNIVKFLLERRANPNVTDLVGNTPLDTALQMERLDVVELLLDKGADINILKENGDVALHYASWRGYRNTVNFLLDMGTDVNTQNNVGVTALHYASTWGRFEVITLLLERGADASIQNEEGETALHSASLQQDRNIASLLLDRGADINVQDNHGKTALHHASRLRRNEIVELLHDKSANVNIQSKDGETALHYASWQDYCDIANLLLEGGTDTNIQNDYDETALHHASRWGHLGIARLLLRKGVVIDIHNNEGDTALHCASHQGYHEIVELLLDSGADVHAENENGHTPLQVAMKNGCQKEMADLLQSRGAFYRPPDWIDLIDYNSIYDPLTTDGAPSSSQDCQESTDVPGTD